MATRQDTIDFLLEHIAGAGELLARKMFGEYAIYCDAKVVALVCDDQLFVKPTEAGRGFAAPCPEAPPYPGAKPYLWIEGHRWDDREWMARLVKVTAAALPLPKDKSPRAAKASGKPKARPRRSRRVPGGGKKLAR
jgi:TfoX/Sxy family transcriptional regulator of competence genes